ITVAVLGVAAFAWSGSVFARTLYNNYGPYGQGMMGGYGYGQGMMGGYGYGMMDRGYDSAMYEYMVTGLADALNLNPEDVENRIQAGETPWQIAQAEGFTDEQFQQVMQAAHDQALQAAVDAGELTQEQAEWMDQRMESMWSGDYRGFGGCHSLNDWNNADGSSSGSHFNPMMGGRWGDSF
ncbi:MAG TPA: hypothetical protein VK856_13750, partial [Anaerolineaceae bacterium]|nr:hypothetical protein [Anaerolineaceae bacterium]